MKRVFLVLVAMALLAGPAFGTRVAIELQPTSDGRNLYGSPPSNAIYEIKALCDSQPGWTSRIVTADSINTTAKLANYDVVVTGGTGYGADNDFASIQDTLLRWVRSGGGFVSMGWYVYSINNAPGVWSEMDTVCATQMVGGYQFITSGTCHITNGSHPITTGVSDFSIYGYGEYSIGVWPGATTLGNYSAAPSYASIVCKGLGSGRSVYLGPVAFGTFGGYPARSYYTDLNSRRLIKQAIAWAGTPPNNVGCTRILAPVAAVDSGATVTPACSVYNFGGVAASYPVRMKIGAGYNYTAQVTSHAPSTFVYVTFPDWTASPRGAIAVSCSTELTGDGTPGNDKATGTVMVNVHDVGATAIKAPAGPVDSGATLTPACSLYNYGTTSESYTARMKIGASYDNTASVSSHAAGTYVYVTFPTWTATVRGANAMSCSTQLAVDVYPLNDKVTGSVTVNVHDWAASAIVAPSGAIGPGPIAPQATVHNNGTVREAGKVIFRINAIPSYAESIPLSGGLPPGVDTTVTFPSWTASTGSYTAKCTVALAGDQIVTNNAVQNQFSVGDVDVGVTATLAPIGNNDTGAVLIPSATVENFGDFPATFTVTFKIDSTGGSVYTASATVTGLAPNATSTVAFDTWAKPHPTGNYTTRCSTYLAGDGNPANDAMGGSFVIRAGGGGSGETGWVRKTDVPLGPKGKKMKDGGCLAYNEEGSGRDADTGFVYTLKGGNTCEFYKYNTAANTWVAKESIPALGLSGKKKKVKKGGTLSQSTGKVYATKGSSTIEWWQYDPALSGTPTYPWTQKTDVPMGLKMVKEGAGAAAVQVGDTSYIYFLKGSATQEFYRYNTLSNTWQSLTNAPLGVSGKSFKAGSTIAYDEDNRTIYAVKGTYNEFFGYSVDSSVWTTKTPLPLIGRDGKKRKVKDGAGLAYHGGNVYALKGGNTNEFWSYQADSNRWTQGPDMPAVSKRVKGGGAMVYAALVNGLYATRGNNTSEFFRYGLTAYGEPQASSFKPQAMGSVKPQATSTKLEVFPNPFSGTTAISFTLPKADNYSLRLYDISGQLVATLANGYHSAGASTLKLQASSLPAGIYIIRLEADNTTTTQKLIVE